MTSPIYSNPLVATILQPYGCVKRDVANAGPDLSAERDAAIARTDIFRIQPVPPPPGG
jgi:hypothetical protein